MFGIGLPAGFAEQALRALSLSKAKNGLVQGWSVRVEILVVGAVQEVLAVHQRAVHLLAVQQVGHGLAHAQVVEGRPPHVHGEALESERAGSSGPSA